MNNILADLWHGDIAPIEEFEVNNSEISHLLQLMAKNSENLDKTLNDKQKSIFEKYCNCVEEYLSLTTEKAFCDGFSLGCKILMTALNTNT